MLIPEGLAAQLDALDELGRMSEAAIAERRHERMPAIVSDMRQVLAAIGWSIEGADERTQTMATQRVVAFERENRRRQQMLIARRETLGREIAQAKRVRRMIVARMRGREPRASVLDTRR